VRAVRVDTPRVQGKILTLLSTAAQSLR